MEVTVTYAARHGSHISDKDAAVIGPEIDTITRKNGGGALDVLECASSEESALHPYFDWDNEVAAEKWRLRQARDLMEAVHVVVKEPTEESPRETVRAFHVVSTREDPEAKIERRFYPLDVVMSNEDWAEQVVQRARAELRTFRIKYSRYQEYIKCDKALARAFNEIHKLEDE